MSKNGYNVLAVTLAVCGTLLGGAAIINGAPTVDVVALTAPFIGAATTIAGRGTDAEDLDEDMDVLDGEG